MRHEGRMVSLTKRGGSLERDVLLVLLGQKLLRKNVGTGRARRYRLTNQGLMKAQGVAQSLATDAAGLRSAARPSL